MEKDRLNENDKSGFFSKLSRTLFIGNLNENINDAILYKYFEEFGDIISVNIKKEDYVSDISKYALIIYFDTSSVVLAMLKMNGVDIEGCRIYLGFGKSFPSKCVWITGIKQSEDNNFLLTYLADCGPIISCSIDQINKRALVYFKEIVNAETAINKMKDGFINGLYFHGDYASTKCQEKFAEAFNKPNRKKCLSINLDNVDSQKPSLTFNVTKQESAASYYVETDSSIITPKEQTSPITCVWVNDIPDSVTDEYLKSHFSQFGPIKSCLVDQSNKCALLCFQQELHAQSAITSTNGSFIKGESVYLRLASLMCQSCEESNTNNDNFIIQQPDRAAESLPNSTLVVPCKDFRTTLPSCKSTINDEICPTNIIDPHNKSMNVDNAQNISQQKDLDISNIDMPEESSCTVIYADHPSETLKPPIQYAMSNVLSLPLPEFANDIYNPISPYSISLSSNSDIYQSTYNFNLHHNEIDNRDFSKTDKPGEKDDQNNNHPIKSDHKILESVKSVDYTSEQSVFVEEAKRLLYVSKEQMPKECFQHQPSPKFQDQRPRSSSFQYTLSTNGSLNDSIGPSASVIQTQNYLTNDTQPIIIPQNSKAPLIDSQYLTPDLDLLIDPKFSSTRHKLSDLNGLCLAKKNICTLSNTMHTSDALNSNFTNTIPENNYMNDEDFEIIRKIRHEYTNNWVITGKWLPNTLNSVEQLNHRWLSDINEKEKEDQKKPKSEVINNKQKPLDGFIANNSIKPVAQPIFVDVEKLNNNEDGTDYNAYEKSIANILLSLNQNKTVSYDTKDKTEKTNCNEFKDSESQNSSNTKAIGCKIQNINLNKIQGEVEKTNVNKYKSKHLNKNKGWKKNIYFDQHDVTAKKKIKDCKPNTLLGSESIDTTSNKSQLFEFDMFEKNNTTNQKKELLINSETNNIKKNKDYKFSKGHANIEEEKQNIDILENHKNSEKKFKFKKDTDLYQSSSTIKLYTNDDKTSKKDFIKNDENITSSYCSKENSLKRVLPSENQNDSKRWKTDNTKKTYKNNCTKTSEHHSPVSKPRKNIHSHCKSENKIKNRKLNKTTNQTGSRGWMNGLSIFDILSKEPTIHNYTIK